MEKGSIKGFQDALSTVRKKEDELNEFVENFAEAVNMISTGSSEENENDFFVFQGSSGNSAKNISVNKKFIDNPGFLVTGVDPENSVSGDGSRAKAIADLQNTSLDFGNIEFESEDSFHLKNDDSGSPVFDYYNDIITDMGIAKQQADNRVDNQMDLVSLLDQRKDSVSGVDMNEEVVDMIRFQSAFQANARVISTINEMLDTLINRTGV